MKIRKPLSSWAAVTVAVVLTTSSVFGEKRWDAPAIVTSNCSGCHGIDGNAQLPYFPKLAGLDAAYAEKKLSAFKEPDSPPVDELFFEILKLSRPGKAAGNASHEERINMEGEAHVAPPETMKEALVWYARQPGAHGHSGDKVLVQQGKDLFLHGLPAQKVLACMTCHGPEAGGKGLSPRLAGQNAKYIEAQLEKFRKGDRKHAPEMTMVTRDLDAEQARAAAVYLQSL